MAVLYMQIWVIRFEIFRHFLCLAVFLLLNLLFFVNAGGLSIELNSIFFVKLKRLNIFGRCQVLNVKH